MSTKTNYTKAELEKLTISGLKKLALEQYDADDIKGLKKAQLVELLDDFYNSDPEADMHTQVDDEEDDEIDDEVDDTDDELEDVDIDELDDEDIAPASNDSKKAKAAISKATQKANDKEAPPEPTGDTLTAKQVATRIGTDAKTLRKFFRSSASTVEAVGMGGRYEFAKSDLKKIQAEFEKWNTAKPTRTPRAAGDKDAPKGRMASVAAAEELPDEELELDDEDLELDDEELDDLELDD